MVTKIAAQDYAALPAKSAADRVHQTVHTVSLALGIVGAAGAALVWLVANFYVGDVEIKTSRPVSALVVKVYGQKGQELNYHMNKLQLFPGVYHLEVTPEGGKVQHSEVKVKYGKLAVVPIAVDEAAAAPAEKEDSAKSKQHWWQFWRK